MPKFRRVHKLRFSQTDYAGIMFYPRYFELLNAVVEDWFAEELGAPFHELLDKSKIATPLAVIETEFRAPFRLGDQLAFELSVDRLGAKSVTLIVITKLDDEARIISKVTHVCAERDLSGATRWCPALYEKMKLFVCEDETNASIANT